MSPLFSVLFIFFSSRWMDSGGCAGQGGGQFGMDGSGVGMMGGGAANRISKRRVA